MTRKRIAVVTGTRAEYGLLRSVMAAISVQPRLELQVIVTGMHLLPKFGHTVRQIERDGWPIVARVKMQQGRDDPLDQARGLGRGVEGIAAALAAARSDVVVVLGDRVEALAGALAAITAGCTLGHIHGGDVAVGDFDESFRHAITKLAHLHFAATRSAVRRLERLGERPETIHLVGAPGLDDLRPLLDEAPPAREPFALVVQHAYGRDAETESRAARAVLESVAALGLPRVVLYPNSDRGHAGVVRVIEAHAAGCNGGVELLRSIPREAYLRKLMAARVLVGNSSSGLLEAPLAGTPVVNVGTRQAGREPGGSAIVHTAETKAAITKGLRQALRLRPRRGGKNVYGDGHAGERIAAVLAQTRLTDALRRKQITY